MGSIAIEQEIILLRDEIWWKIEQFQLVVSIFEELEYTTYYQEKQDTFRVQKYYYIFIIRKAIRNNNKMYVPYVRT